MVYCTGCGEPLGYEVKFCGKCGTAAESAPRAVGKGLDPKRFGQGGATGPSQGGAAAPSGGGGGGGGEGSEMDFSDGSAASGAAVPAGQLGGGYEDIKPSSWEKSTQTLELRADGTCSYTEVGKTSMEEFVSSGDGTWDCKGGVVAVNIRNLVKEMKFKTKPLVPGIGDGTAEQGNVIIPITATELQNAPKHGTNKWRRKS